MLEKEQVLEHHCSFSSPPLPIVFFPPDHVSLNIFPLTVKNAAVSQPLKLVVLTSHTMSKYLSITAGSFSQP